MPIIKGRYYMNPQYGASLENARVADDESVRTSGAPQPSWLDYFLGLVSSANEQEQINQRDNDSSDIFPETSANGDSGELEAQNVPTHTQPLRSRTDDVTVGNSVYNETSGLRPTSPTGEGSAQDLSDARVGLADVTKNRDAAGTAVGKGTAPGQLAGSEASAVKTYPPAKQAYEDSRAAAGKAHGDPKGPHNFYLDWGQGKPPWAEGKQPKESYGPFLNVADGDVPRGATVRIRIYDLGGQNGKR